ncbi:hypothetical protein [uncultured Aquimonas sp.]|uniref:hypothetical protein n=1 Tax=uncultured Aquimonas sp. TaxID=385483 RepID=UPI00086C83E0|nr:hypothetical protein [uncultured Aquimonas sp.]ODU46189.1 MAG: hypothetical protein ABS96_09795 [Xanthomonadaceae bacterium SCN 69-123]
MKPYVPASLWLARLLFAIWIIVVSALPYSLALSRSKEPGAASLALATIGLLGAFALLESLRALKPAMVLVTLALVPLAVKWLLRVGFVVKNGGMDCGSCQGSPLLFGYYWLIETLILMPGLLLLGWLLILLLHQRKV